MAAYWEIAAHRLGLQCVFLVQVSNCQFSFFSHFGFWSGNFFLIAPFPDHCLLVPFYLDYLCISPPSLTGQLSRIVLSF